nr:uncharacterized protein LOC101238236 isoform X2 [Hydra vulgaris]
MLLFFTHSKMKSNLLFVFVFTLLNFQGIQGSCYKVNSDVGDINYRCDLKITNKKSHIDIDVETCRNTTINIVFHILISEIGLNFRTTLKGSQEIPIPGFSIAYFIGLYLRVRFYDNKFGEVKLKLSLSLKAIGTITTIPLIDEKISTENCHGEFYSNSNQNTFFIQSKIQTYFIFGIVSYIFISFFL